jgi:hypothetical protein
MIIEYWPEEIQALAAAMSQLLDDMGKEGVSVCIAAKAQARIAYEPFAESDEKESIMQIEVAQKLLQELS